jgi:hypothetical protein
MRTRRIKNWQVLGGRLCLLISAPLYSLSSQTGGNNESRTVDLCCVPLEQARHLSFLNNPRPDHGVNYELRR